MTLRSSKVLAVFVMFSPVATGCTSVAELQPEHPARIRVGDRVAVRVELTCPCSRYTDSERSSGF